MYLTLNVVGVVSGATGYALGTRVPGIVVVVPAVIILFGDLYFEQAMIPGAYDRLVNGHFL